MRACVAAAIAAAFGVTFTLAAPARADDYPSRPRSAA